MNLPTLPPEEAGWNQEALSELVSWCGEVGTSQLVLVHRGSVIANHSWEDETADSTFDIASVQKSVISFLVGQSQSMRHGYFCAISSR